MISLGESLVEAKLTFGFRRVKAGQAKVVAEFEATTQANLVEEDFPGSRLHFAARFCCIERESNCAHQLCTLPQTADD